MSAAAFRCSRTHHTHPTAPYADCIAVLFSYAPVIPLALSASLLSLQTSIMRGIGAGTRIFELLDRKPAIPPNQGITVDPSRRGTVKFENVGFEYPSRKGVVILDNFNLELGVGESVAIV